MFKFKTNKRSVLFLFVVLFLSAITSYRYRGLSFEVEGIVGANNFRDAGESYAACLGESATALDYKLASGRLLRSGIFFSGWSCYQLGNPSVILSLNYSPSKKMKFFCVDNELNVVATHPSSTFKQDITDLNNKNLWTNDEGFLNSICPVFSEAFDSLARSKSILTHCEAGRDRTGSAIGLILGSLIEVAGGPLQQKNIDAIECDYRKSRSLKPFKYGSVEKLIKFAQQDFGGVSNMLAQQCGITLDKITLAAQASKKREKNLVSFK